MESVIDIKLPMLNCGACGYKSCDALKEQLIINPKDIAKCVHIKTCNTPNNGVNNGCNRCGEIKMGDKLEWKDSLKRDFDFILDCFENEPGPRETILLYNPALVKEMDIQKGDVLVGRPMGMSCGCPVTHCGVASDVDPKNGVVHWNVTGPLRPRSQGFKDIGYYVSQAYEGVIKESKVPIQLGMRYWFLPRRCMLQWRHSGLVNAVSKTHDGYLKIRVEGLLIG